MKAHQDDSCGRGHPGLAALRIDNPKTWLCFDGCPYSCLHMCVCLRVSVCVCVLVCVWQSSARPAAGGNGLRSVNRTRMRRGMIQPQGEQSVSATVWPTGATVN